MQTIDEQLDSATAKVAELTEQLAVLTSNLAEAQDKQSNLEAVNAELTDNLSAAKNLLAEKEKALHETENEVARLKAEAKTAEERAAEIYGATSGTAAAVTAKGDSAALPVAERFRAITSPAAQTTFLRSLSDSERNELFSTL